MERMRFHLFLSRGAMFRSDATGCRIGGPGSFYGIDEAMRSFLPPCSVIDDPFLIGIRNGNIPKYFQISCDYFCL